MKSVIRTNFWFIHLQTKQSIILLYRNHDEYSNNHTAHEREQEPFSIRPQVCKMIPQPLPAPTSPSTLLVTSDQLKMLVAAIFSRHDVIASGLSSNQVVEIATEMLGAMGISEFSLEQELPHLREIIDSAMNKDKETLVLELESSFLSESTDAASSSSSATERAASVSFDVNHDEDASIEPASTALRRQRGWLCLHLFPTTIISRIPMRASARKRSGSALGLNPRQSKQQQGQPRQQKQQQLPA